MLGREGVLLWEGANFQVCNLTKASNYKYIFDQKTRSAYMYGGDKQWLGLEDPVTMFSKATYPRVHLLAGIMIFDLGCDDYEVSIKYMSL